MPVKNKISPRECRLHKQLLNPLSKNGSNKAQLSRAVLPSGNKGSNRSSSEAWGQIIIHELLHTFVTIYAQEIAVQHLDHQFMFKNFVNVSKNLLVSSFGMDEGLACGWHLAE
jgi:hypothetical protein